MWQWSVSDVTEWLRAIGPPYAAYAAAFAANCLDGSAVMELTTEVLTEELKVAKLHALCLVSKIKAAIEAKARATPQAPAHTNAKARADAPAAAPCNGGTATSAAAGVVSAVAVVNTLLTAQSQAAAAAASAAAAAAAKFTADIKASADKAVAEAAAAAAAANEEKLCVVCLDAAKAVVFVPCGHVQCCTACGERVGACPLCRAAITTRQRVFL